MSSLLHIAHCMSTCMLVHCMHAHVNLHAQLARALEPYKLKWIEECLHPDDYHDGYTELRQALLGTTLVTTAEHEYSYMCVWNQARASAVFVCLFVCVCLCVSMESHVFEGSPNAHSALNHDKIVAMVTDYLWRDTVVRGVSILSGTLGFSE